MHSRPSHHPTDRRRFLFTLASLSGAAFVFGLGGYVRSAWGALGKRAYPSTLTGGAPCGSCEAPADLSWKTVVPPPNEAGEPLQMSGTIYEADGVTPATGFVLFVYHTDVTGYYNKDDDASHPRLRGWMRTGADGRYEFRTIRPGAYPHRNTPAHIHAHLYGPDYSERPIEDFWFKSDPRITPETVASANEQDSHPVIVALERGGDGIWRGRRDIRVKR